MSNRHHFWVRTGSGTFSMTNGQAFTTQVAAQKHARKLLAGLSDRVRKFEPAAAVKLDEVSAEVHQLTAGWWAQHSPDRRGRFTVETERFRMILEMWRT